VILPISKAEMLAAEAVVGQAIKNGVRVEVAGPEHGTLSARIRANRLVPYHAIIGPAEAAAEKVSLRLRDGRKLPAAAAAEALARIVGLIQARAVELWKDSSDERS
jgi:threonyl-tRNA synthetase